MTSVASCSTDINSASDSTVNGKSDKKRFVELALIKEIQTREQKNKRDLKKIRQLMVKEAKKRMKVKLILQTSQKTNATLKRDNAKMENGLKKALDGMENVDSELDSENDQGRRVPDERLTKNIFDGKGKLKNNSQLASTVKGVLDNLGNKLQGKQQQANQKYADCDRLKGQLDEQEANAKDKRNKRDKLKQKLEAQKQIVAQLEQPVTNWLKDFYRIIRGKPKQFGLPNIKAFQTAAQTIIEISDESEELKRQRDDLKDKQRELNDRDKLITQMKEEHKKILDNLEILVNRYTQTIVCLTERQECQPMPSQYMDESSAEYLKTLHCWLEKENRLFQPQLEQTEQRVQQAMQWNLHRNQIRNREIVQLNDLLKQLTDGWSSLKAENDKMQSIVDRTDFERCMQTKQAVEMLKKMVKETAECFYNQQSESRSGVCPKASQEEKEAESEDQSASNLERNARQLMRRKERREDELKRILKELGRLEQKQLEKRQELNERLASLDARKEDLLKETEWARLDAQQADDLEKRIDEASQRCEAHEKENHEKEEKLRNLRRDIAVLKINVTLCESRFKNMVQSIHCLKKLNNVRQNRIKREKLTLNELNNDLKNETVKRTSTEEQLARLETPCLKPRAMTPIPQKGAAEQDVTVYSQLQMTSLNVLPSMFAQSSESVVTTKTPQRETESQIIEKKGKVKELLADLGRLLEDEMKLIQIQELIQTIDQADEETKKLYKVNELLQEMDCLNVQEIQLTDKLSKEKVQKKDVSDSLPSGNVFSSSISSGELVLSAEQPREIIAKRSVVCPDKQEKLSGSLASHGSVTKSHLPIMKQRLTKMKNEEHSVDNNAKTPVLWKAEEKQKGKAISTSEKAAVLKCEEKHNEVSSTSCQQRHPQKVEIVSTFEETETKHVLKPKVMQFSPTLDEIADKHQQPKKVVETTQKLGKVAATPESVWQLQSTSDQNEASVAEPETSLVKQIASYLNTPRDNLQQQQQQMKSTGVIAKEAVE